MWGLIFCLFITAIPVFWYVKSILFTRELEGAPIVSATIIDCEKVVDKKGDFAHYKITYSFIDDKGVTQIAEEPRERKMKVGRIIKKFYIINHGKNVLVDLKTLEENKTGSASFLLWFSGVVIIIGLVAFIAEQNISFRDVLSEYVLPFTIGPLFVFASICFIKSYIRNRKDMKDTNTIKIIGKIVGYNEKASNNKRNGPCYYPIYEYRINGKVARYESDYNSKKKKIGTEATLYYNKKTKNIFEKSETGKELSMGIIMGVFGLIAILSGILAIVL